MKRARLTVMAAALLLAACGINETVGGTRARGVALEVKERALTFCDEDSFVVRNLEFWYTGTPDLRSLLRRGDRFEVAYATNTINVSDFGSLKVVGRTTGEVSGLDICEPRVEPHAR